jgi:radical SAM protein with 4Fe4S-binding SPASM domain
MKIYESKKKKIIFSESYNYSFDKETGSHLRWGGTRQDNPVCSPHGPEIADIEISTICDGVSGKPCDFCYKNNIRTGRNMSLGTFMELFHKLPRTLTQIAFGVGSIDANPDLFEILEYCRNNAYQEIIPNITINGSHMNSGYYDRLVKLCGAIAVSKYKPKEICYSTVKELTDRDHNQINIHQLVAEETFSDCLNLIADVKTNSSLKGLNAVVFLALKPKGKRNRLHVLSRRKYEYLVNKCLEYEINFGFDSCSTPKFWETVKDHKNYASFSALSEPCESALFSIYINVDGEILPCSFMQGEELKPQSLLENDFMNIWNGAELDKFRSRLLKTAKDNICRKCPKFEV